MEKDGNHVENGKQELDIVLEKDSKEFSIHFCGNCTESASKLTEFFQNQFVEYQQIADVNGTEIDQLSKRIRVFEDDEEERVSYAEVVQFRDVVSQKLEELEEKHNLLKDMYSELKSHSSRSVQKKLTPAEEWDFLRTEMNRVRPETRKRKK